MGKQSIEKIDKNLNILKLKINFKSIFLDKNRNDRLEIWLKTFYLNIHTICKNSILLNDFLHKNYSKFYIVFWLIMNIDKNVKN